MAVYRLLNTADEKTEPALCGSPIDVALDRVIISLCKSNTVEKNQKNITGNFLRGHYPLSLQIFSLYLKYNTMKCVIQNIDKTPIEADFHHYM